MAVMAAAQNTGRATQHVVAAGKKTRKTVDTLTKERKKLCTLHREWYTSDIHWSSSALSCGTPIRPKRYKTKLCRSWLAHEKCEMELCSYALHPYELRITTSWTGADKNNNNNNIDNKNKKTGNTKKNGNKRWRGGVGRRKGRNKRT